MSSDGKRKTRITPHDEEDDDFDWRESIQNIEEPTYVITPDPIWTQKIRDDLRKKFYFTWNQKEGQWETFDDMDQNWIDELLDMGIEVEKFK